MALEEFGLEGKAAIVTGAGRGIGKAIALALAEAGADVAVIARTARQIEQTADEIRASGRRALPIRLDVTDENEVAKAVGVAVSKFGSVDILCCNAGILPFNPIVASPDEKITGWQAAGDNWNKPLTPEIWRNVLDTNLTSALLFSRAVGPHFIKQRKGKIVITSSTAADQGQTYLSAYCVSKAGLSSLTRCLASEWGQFNVTANAIAPGMIDTDMIGPVKSDPEQLRAILSLIPLGRLGQPRDVALLALFLASPASDYISGQVFTIDGGAMGRGPGI